jgi:hypothetical protein
VDRRRARRAAHLDDLDDDEISPLDYRREDVRPSTLDEEDD